MRSVLLTLSRAARLDKLCSHPPLKAPHLPWLWNGNDGGRSCLPGLFSCLLLFGRELRLVRFRRSLLVVLSHGNLSRVQVAELSDKLCVPIILPKRPCSRF